MPHAVDKLGFPIDPELRRLEFHLSELAARWRGTYRQDVVEEYHTVMARLYESGWDGILNAESELPDELMPIEYLRRHP